MRRRALVAPLLLCVARAATAASVSPLERAKVLYYRGDLAGAVRAYDRAAAGAQALQALLDAGAVLEELGRPKEAAVRFAKAAALSAEADIQDALGWAQARSGDLAAAATSFATALLRQDDHPWARVGAARAALGLGRPQEALEHLAKAAEAAPLLGLIPYYEAQAYEALGRQEEAVSAYRRAVAADSYFTEGRESLGRAYLRQRRHNDAWRQFIRALESEPKSRRLRDLALKVQPLLTRRPADLRAGSPPSPVFFLRSPVAAPAAVPVIRVAIGTTPGGQPRLRSQARFLSDADFEAVDASSGRLLFAGKGRQRYTARAQKVKKGWHIAWTDENGRLILRRRETVLLKPREGGAIAVDPLSGPEGWALAPRVLRGAVEVALHGRGLRLVNALDLESYTHGVLSAEMPIKSPAEALKAQAVLARTHALYLKRFYKNRHKGYDLCDEQHCQVYTGVRAESRRSREIVEATRARIVTYQGKPAHVIYASNCGGRTQSGRDVTGWGHVPYWLGVADSPAGGEESPSPWKLRRSLLSWPGAFCKPSNDVHPSHFRWTRIVSWADLSEKLDRKLKIGRLKSLRPLRRAPSGHVNAILVEGTRRTAKVDSEIQIRGLLGMGSLRSTLFALSWELGRDGKLKRLLLHGGGWGHGVGLCQSGAMGRAEAGQNYEQIIKAYFPGVELGTLDY